MNNISVSDMMNKTKILKQMGEAFTLMGVGPMSKVCVEAVLQSARELDYPVMLIASRNQVDSDAFGHGYVCGWNQQRFIKDTTAIAEKIGFDGLLYFCRDHGGPWQRDEERGAKLSKDKAFELSIKSYSEDMREGFHLLHIDPTKDPFIEGVVPLGIVLERTVELIETLENIRVFEGLPEIAYEVGTEETNGGLTSERAFKEFLLLLLKKLKQKGLPKPEFIVGQTGTLTRLTENVGKFDLSTAARLSKIAFDEGVGIKQHNSDYLRDSMLLAHPHLGVTAANIAPEFGVVETKAYLELAHLEGLIYEEKASGFARVIAKKSIESGKWRKWMPTNAERDMEIGEIMSNSELTSLIVNICGHYTYEDPEVACALKNMERNLRALKVDAESYAVRKVRDSIERYAVMFRLPGLTKRLLSI